jgi:hypothetical protein
VRILLVSCASRGKLLRFGVIGDGFISWKDGSGHGIDVELSVCRGDDDGNFGVQSCC